MTLTPVAPLTIDPMPGDASGVGLRVLAATSGSQASRRATVAAAALAGERGGRLILVRVVPPVHVRVVRLGPALASVSRLGDPFSDPVLLAARQLAWDCGVLAEVVLVAGPVAEAIVMTARETNAALVVVGARHAAGWRSWRLFAPTRARVERDAAVPVIVAAAVSRHRSPSDGLLGSIMGRA